MYKGREISTHREFIRGSIPRNTPYEKTNKNLLQASKTLGLRLTLMHGKVFIKRG